MMKYLLSLWLLGSALLPLLADEVPDLAARIRYVDRATGSDGITQESQWQEKWLRVGDQVWSQRLIPVPWPVPITPPTMPAPATSTSLTRWRRAGSPQRGRRTPVALRRCLAQPAGGSAAGGVRPGGLQAGVGADPPPINPALLEGMTPLDEAAPTRRTGMRPVKVASVPASSGRAAGSCPWWWSRQASTVIAATGWR